MDVLLAFEAKSSALSVEEVHGPCICEPPMQLKGACVLCSAQFLCEARLVAFGT